MRTLTGKRRFRMGGLFRTKLILQVQIVDTFRDRFGDKEEYFNWKDARVQDLMTIQACHKPFPIEGQRMESKNG